MVSVLVFLTNNNAGEGVAAMISETFTPKFVAETGTTQILSAKVATVLPTGATGPVIEVAVISDLDTTTSTVSDVLTILSM